MSATVGSTLISRLVRKLGSVVSMLYCSTSLSAINALNESDPTYLVEKLVSASALPTSAFLVQYSPDTVPSITLYVAFSTRPSSTAVTKSLVGISVDASMPRNMPPMLINA